MRFMILVCWFGVVVFGSCTTNPGAVVQAEPIHSPDNEFAYVAPTEQNLGQLVAQAPGFHPYPGLNDENVRKFNKLSEKVYKFSPWPQAGYNYDYYLYIPSSNPGSAARNKLLAISIASGGEQGRGVEYYSDWARKVVMNGNWETRIADALGTILIYPAFDRPQNSSHASLTVAAVSDKRMRHSRLDLQFLAMIDDALSFLQTEKGISLDKEFLLAGFSMSGSFASRFTLMHPERVSAAAYGGMSCMHILPYSSDLVSGTRLIYPTGVADIESISGKPFNRSLYMDIPKFYFEGAKDSGDVAQYGGLFPPEMQPWLHSRIGKDLDKRWARYSEILKDSHAVIDLTRYPDLGHNLKPEDVVAFFLRHLD
jgi:hypothetical protein